MRIGERRQEKHRFRPLAKDSEKSDEPKRPLRAGIKGFLSRMINIFGSFEF